MRPIFTIHAGEYLVGSEIEKMKKHYSIWIPSKDTGIDLLIKNDRNKKLTTIQVKFSKDFLASNMPKTHKKDLIACGWWTLRKDKIKKSKADFWVLVLYSFNEGLAKYLIIKKAELLKRLSAIHKHGNTISSYIWVTKKNKKDKEKCWETRDLKKQELQEIANGKFTNKDRNFTKYLDNWQQITAKLK